MDEEKTKELPANDTGTGDKPKELNLVEQANVAAERMEKANQRQEELLKRQEELDAKRALAGRAEAGITPEKPKEETPEEYSKRVEAGEVNPLET